MGSITVKVTDVGGYIMGDGELPKGFNADKFLADFLAGKIKAANDRPGNLFKLDDVALKQYCDEVAADIAAAPIKKVRSMKAAQKHCLEIGSSSGTSSYVSQRS